MLTRPIKAVFFDIDGTLLSFKTHKVAKSTEQAIELLKEKDIKVILSTGRSINSIDHIKYLDFDGYITFNGGYCLTKDFDLLFKQTINSNDIKSVLDCAKDPSFSFSFMSEKEITIHNVTPEIEGMYTHLNLPVPKLIDFENVDTSSVLQINIFMGLESQSEFMKTVLPNSDASRWSPLFADVNPKGQSKKIGVDIFCNHFNLSIDETMAFGDGGNDIEMLESVKVGVAMGNGTPEIKSVANYITTDVDNDGIWNALKHFNVI